MADAYSFDVSKETMRASYDKMFDAYCKAFDRIGVEYYPVEADAGSIGGDVNHEFMVPAAIGEDYFARCLNCGYKANIEAARRFSNFSDQGFEGSRPISEIFTGPTATVGAAIKEIEKLRPEITAADMIKSIVLLDEKGALVLALVPGDRKVRIPPGMKALDNAAFGSYSFLHLGYVGPMEMQERGVRVLADHSIDQSKYWTTGGNRPDYHVLDVVLDRDFTVDEYLDLVVVEEGDLCPKCQSSMNLVRSVEAGHTFQLGLTYPEKIASARFSADDGVESMYYMGCYGIGVSRLPAVVAEVSNDAAGLVWPVSVAPYQVHIVAISYGKNPEVSHSSDLIYESLLAAGIEVLLDDRDLGPGVKLNDADLIGVPLQLVVGPKGLARGVIDLKVRASGEKSEMPVSEVVDVVRTNLAALLASVSPK